jgi:hypothetical protein
MDETTQSYNNGENEIKPISYDGTYFLLLLMRYKWFIIISVIIVTTASVFYTLSLENWYQASVNAIPSKSQGGLFDNMLRIRYDQVRRIRR